MKPIKGDLGQSLEDTLESRVKASLERATREREDGGSFTGPTTWSSWTRISKRRRATLCVATGEMLSGEEVSAGDAVYWDSSLPVMLLNPHYP